MQCLITVGASRSRFLDLSARAQVTRPNDLYVGLNAVESSPTFAFRGKEKFQAFSAIGMAKDRQPYQFNIGDGFCPFRRDVKWLIAHEAPIVCHSNHFDHIAFQAIDQPIAESLEVSAPKTRPEWMPCVGILQYQSPRLRDFFEKPFPQSDVLQFQPDGCFVQFPPRHSGEPKSHIRFNRARASAMTSSKS